MHIEMIAIVDCNSFYASCERIYRPDLRNVPVVVLSNNDGCVIALTADAKAMGIVRGAAFFEVRGLIRAKGIKVFSSNYVLYHSISERIMSILAEFTPQIEVYSIDEAWLNMDGLADRVDLAKQMRATILQWVKMPVSIGIAPTKTLAKIANKIGKKRADGVCELAVPEYIDHVLDGYDIADIWGIGRALNRRLQGHGIYTAKQLRDAPTRWVRKLNSVGLERTVRELRGEPCIDFETAPLRATVMVSRMFGKKLYNKAEIKEALCKYCGHAALKLRKGGLVAKHMTIFIRTTSDDNFRGVSRSCKFDFDSGTDSTIFLSKMAGQMLDQIFKAGPRYMKAGIMLDGLTLKDQTQFSLFNDAETPKQDLVMSAIDKINTKFGNDKIGLLSAGINREWKMKQEYLSPRYTTRWADMPIVR